MNDFNKYKKYEYLFTDVPMMNCVYAITVNNYIVYIGSTSNLRQAITALYYDIKYNNSNYNIHKNNLLYDFLEDDNYITEIQVIKEVRGIKKKETLKKEYIAEIKPPLNYRIPILDSEEDDYETQPLPNTPEETLIRATYTIKNAEFKIELKLEDD